MPDGHAGESSKTTSRILIGTSGWVYKEWANDFYRGIKAKDQLSFYASQFPTVEINATFYRLAALTMVRGWHQRSPDGFIFAVKGSRFITHIKRLDNLQNSVNKFFRRMQPLRSKMGPILWQLPPDFKKDPPRLQRFLRRLPKAFFHAFEFRHLSWMEPDILDMLRRFNTACVSVSSMKMPRDFSVTADFVYLRFHGLEGGPRHDYTETELAPWAEHIRTQALAGRPVFAYFNNDLNVRAPNNARLLMKLCRLQS
jgi:uncharacterized protein YecE (DUF72 family)